MLQKNNREKILFFNETAFKVARLIFNAPTKTFHLRMLAREAGFSTTAVSRAVERLSYFQIVKTESTDITTNIKADVESEAYSFYKRIFDLYRLKRYSLVNVLTDIFENPRAIVLFGSFARGEDIEKSDIDILVISPVKMPQDMKSVLKPYEEEFNREINIHLLESLEKSSKEFKNSVANGIVLHGYLKVS